MDGLWLRRMFLAYVRIPHNGRQGIHFRRKGFMGDVDQLSEISLRELIGLGFNH